MPKGTVSRVPAGGCRNWDISDMIKKLPNPQSDVSANLLICINISNQNLGGVREPFKNNYLEEVPVSQLYRDKSRGRRGMGSRATCPWQALPRQASHPQ